LKRPQKENNMGEKPAITVKTIVNAPIEKVWEFWNEPKHIVKWAFASDTWEAPSAENDLQAGGRFKTRMQAKDGTEGFDFIGTYTQVTEDKLIEYDMDKGDGETFNRHVKIEFEKTEQGTKITETFDPENENSEEIQRSGWQSILDNFKKYVENN
jgi:uncharacterized protein YndB with AHSA1/START domain